MDRLLRKCIDSAPGNFLLGSFVNALSLLGDRKEDLLRVVTYHRIDELDSRPDFHRGVLSASPLQFSEQMEFLARRCHVVSMEEVLDAIGNERNLPPRSVLITFDDAYRDFAEHAWPVLQQHGLPATMFVATDFPGNPSKIFWWDRVWMSLSRCQEQSIETSIGTFDVSSFYACRRSIRTLLRQLKSMPHEDSLKVIEEICGDQKPTDTGYIMDWQQLKELSQAGLTIGPHTRSHPMLNRMSLEQARAEIMGSMQDIETHIGSDVSPTFAYPAGGHNEGVVSILKDLGIQLAFTTCRGINLISQMDRFRIRRINVDHLTRLSFYRAQLTCQARFGNSLFPMKPSS